MSGPDPGMAWRIRRAVARVEPAPTRLLAEQAPSYWQPGVVWDPISRCALAFLDFAK